MYTRQVEKDGIRRTLMTNSGSATERHFSKEDLKRLFYLSPKGDCQMLNKIKTTVSTGAKGSSGNRSILEKHADVIGVSSHDLMYQNEIIDLVEPQRTPFAGTPFKQKVAVVHLTPRKIAFEQTDRDEIIQSNKHGIESGLGNYRNEEKSHSNERDRPKISDDFQKIEKLTKQGEITKSLHILFHLLEFRTNDLHGSDKLRVHKMIASRILHYEWK